jgi:hypothetical protein
VNPFHPREILKVAVVTNGGEADLPKNLVSAFGIVASGVAVHAQWPPFHVVAAWTDIPGGKPEQWNLKFGVVLQFGLRPRREAEMADTKLGFKAGLPNLDALELLNGCAIEPEVQSSGDHGP